MTPEEHQDLAEGCSGIGLSPLDCSTVDRLETFIDLLAVWNRRLRLTGDRDRRVLVAKHVVDWLEVVPELPTAGSLIDLGRGAGFPGIVLGSRRPDLGVRSAEPRRRPTSFLSEVIRIIPLPGARALEIRGEDAARDPSLAGRTKLVVSRALRVELLLSLAPPLLAPDGVVVAMQTPLLTEPRARELARPQGLDLRAVRDYRLPGGVPRRIRVFGRT